ncbi:helix-turn-helix transcriptional regulator [Amycolatopsis sp. Hca4]|uniref:helix-turn-helix domain-containing protein n=1 Tax=Amycolatopsis sp. Hca4 TaxID=2742131 RepID=UPI0020CB224E|nr:Scr1 family TA system antitoxin-like transcriptional regulator [Amycolatopsis sp. Hca4]
MTDSEGCSMDRPAKPNYRRRQLGRTLRKLREAAGLSQEDAGRPLRFSTSKMSRIEQGYIPGYNDFLALLDRYGIIASDYDEYVRMFDYAKEKGWWHAFGLSDRGFVSVEAEASQIRTYQLGFVPGLMQTEVVRPRRPAERCVPGDPAIDRLARWAVQQLHHRRVSRAR